MESGKINLWMKTFSIGYACAVANLIRDHGYQVEGPAMDCLKANFMDIKTMREIGVDETDIEVLKPIVEKIERQRQVIAKDKAVNNLPK